MKLPYVRAFRPEVRWFAEKLNLQIRGELYNAFNSVAFQGFVSSNITSQNFGVYNTLSQNPRLIQLAVRIVF